MRVLVKHHASIYQLIGLSRMVLPRPPRPAYAMVFFVVMILAVVPSLNLKEYNEIITDSIPIPSLTDLSGNSVIENNPKSPSFSIQSFQTPNILFIVDNEISLNPDKDLPFLNFMRDTLNYNVTCHTANASYSYEGYDAIVISNSVSESGTVDSLISAPIPIMTMQAGHCDEFQLGSQYSIKGATQLYILNNTHFVSEGLKNESFFDVYSSENDIQHIKGYSSVPLGVEIDLIALRTDTKGGIFDSDATWVALDKGKRAWDLSIAPERRVFWGAFWGNTLLIDGWNYWNRTLSWLLYDDVPGYATIQVEVSDLDNNTVVNAEVNLTNSWNHSQSWSQNTSSSGSCSFINIPFGYYNITVEYESSINNDYSFLEIAGERTYHLKPFFLYSVQIGAFIDDDPPIITNIQFHPTNSTFSVSVYDVSNIDNVNLSITVRDSTNDSILRNSVYTMVYLADLTYINDTALQGLPITGISVDYNITAKDVAGNSIVSEPQFFTLGDVSAPIVYFYNVTDSGDGSLRFYANVSDVESLVQEVILRINDTDENMYLNASGFWILEKYAYFGQILNYSIFSTTDSVGNENNDSINPKFALITPQDSMQPLIYDVSDTLASHDEGLVIFTAVVEELNQYQSGVNVTSVAIILSIFNGTWYNDSLYEMTALGEITYEFEYSFHYNDTISYRIIATDFAGNLNPGYEHIGSIDDHIAPQLSFDAREYGNGIVEFNSTVSDWPNNATDVKLFFTQDYFGNWFNVSMSNITENLYVAQIEGFDFRLHDVWFYATATDQANNSYEPTPDQYQKVDLTDLIAPHIYFIVDNSTSVDGEIFITAWANDPYGDTPNINNTFKINFTLQGLTSQYEMSYDSFYFYKFNQIFNYNDEVNIKIWTTDSVGNIGSINRSIIIGDFSAPKIVNTGIIEYQNGTATFWADVVEYPTGSGLPTEESSVKVEYVFVSSFNETMSRNESSNIYTYTISGFVPGNAFTYRISAFDNTNNSAVTFWTKTSIEDNTPPLSRGFGYIDTLINQTSTQLDFWVEVEDPFGPVIGVEITIEYFSRLSPITASSEMSRIGNEYIYSLYMPCNTSFNYSIQIYDAKPNILVLNRSNLRSYWGPVVIDAAVEQNPDNSILIWANVSHWGSGVSEVIFEYEYETQGGSGSKTTRINLESVQLEFNGTLYIKTITFSEPGALSWTIIAKDSSGSFTATKSSVKSFFVSFPSNTLSWEEILPLVLGLSLIPIIFILALANIRRRRTRKIEKKKQIEIQISERFNDSLSLRSVICRNNNGLPFYTKTFLEDTQDLDLTAGLTSAVSDLVSEVSKRSMKKGEFDLIEREGFSILSHHGDYSTVSIISEGKLSPYMRERITELHNDIESQFTQENLEDPMFGDQSEYIQGLIYKYLNVVLLSKLTFDFNRFKEFKKNFTEEEKKYISYLSEIPAINDDRVTFYVTTFTSSITRHGVSLAAAYTLLEKCFRYRIIFPITF